MHKMCNQLQQPQHGPVDVSSNTQGLKASFFFFFFFPVCLLSSGVALYAYAFHFSSICSTLFSSVFPSLAPESSASCDLNQIQRIRWIGMVRLYWQGKDEGAYWKI